MIDTIVIRIHKLIDKYQHYGTYLQNLSNGDKTQIKYSTKSIFKDDVQHFQFYSDTGRMRFLSVRNAVHSISSHYNISFNTNYERDYLEINMSIPKYLYGTNVFQFTDHRTIDIHHTWTKLESFFREFFQIYFPTLPDYEDVEINRIDFCLNQIFDTKEDALKYLARQKELNVSYARSERNRFNDYGSTTIQYVTANYSFKVYHKGTEFRKNDLNELSKMYGRNTGKQYNDKSVKVYHKVSDHSKKNYLNDLSRLHNKTAVKQYDNNATYVKINGLDYDLDHITAVADRTLRYELTFRKGALNYVFKQHVKDDENTMFNHNFQRIFNTKTKAGRKFVTDDFQNKSYQFHLSSPWDFHDTYIGDFLQAKSLTFNYELFFRLYDFFMFRVNRYQLEKKLTVPEMYEKLKAHNEKKKVLKKESDNINQLVMIATLSQYTNIDDLKTIIPKRTFYRYKQKLKEAEISYQSIDDIYSPALDFGKYFDLLGNYHVKFN